MKRYLISLLLILILPAQLLAEEDFQNETVETVTEETVITQAIPELNLINEIMVNPEGKDTEGEWIELYNNTDEPIDLGGFFLDDAEGKSSPFKITENTIIEPGGFLVFSEPELKLSFKNSEDEVRLLNPDKIVTENIHYSEARESWTYSKKEGDFFDWTPIVTQGQANEFPPPPKGYGGHSVSFKNVLPNPNGKDGGNEQINLKNNLSEAIDLSKWKFLNEKRKEYYLKGLNINAHQTLELDPAKFQMTLTNTLDSLHLFDPAGNLIDEIGWVQAPDGQKIYPYGYFSDGLKAKVERVIDGDTFIATINDESFTIRLLGVDTPETVHPNLPVEEFGAEASDYLKELIEDKTIMLAFDGPRFDKYNRLLAYAYCDGKMINAELIKEGLAHAYTYFDFKYIVAFPKYEAEAQANERGMWKPIEIIADEEADPEIPNDTVGTEDLASNNDDILEPTEGGEPVEATDTQNEIVEIVEPIIICPTEGLSIHSILPNHEKGKTTEYIRIINKTDEAICLTGWKLDDQLGKGSKPFEISSGGIAPGGIRAFRKSETRIALNNNNDCAYLLNPTGKIMDQICYSKTHKNEIFTHEGGDWQPKQPKVRLTNRTPGKSKISRETTAYQWELKNQIIKGTIESFDDTEEVLYVNLTIPVSYANSNVDIQMAKQLLDFNEPVSLDIHATDLNRELIGINQEKPIEEVYERKKLNPEFKYLTAIMALVGGGLVLRKKNQ